LSPTTKTVICLVVDCPGVYNFTMLQYTECNLIIVILKRCSIEGTGQL